MVNPTIKTTIDKIIGWLCGEENERIDDWLTNDEESYSKMNEFFNKCAACGWINLKDSPFEFADDSAIQLSKQLYQSATAYFGGGKR